MSYYAKWGPKGFTVSTTRLALMEGLSTSLTLKEDSENDTSGTQPTNTRGRELRPISFSVLYLRAAGMDPRDQIDQWEKELGNAYPLMIGGQRFGAEKMKLTEVDASDILLGPTGEFLQARVSITLEEYSEGKKSKLTSTNTTGGTASTASTGSTGSSGADQARATYEATVAEKKAALNAKPSAADKASMIAGRRIEVNCKQKETATSAPASRTSCAPGVVRSLMSA